MQLFNRVKSILLSPKQEWLVIAGENTTAASTFFTYLLPLAVVSSLVFYFALFSIAGAFGFLYGVYSCIILFLQLVITVCLNAFITDKLAPTFASESNFPASIRLMVYASTPVYVGSMLIFIPYIGWLGSLAGAIYGIYLLYLGLPVIKKTPQDKAPGYLAAIVICVLVVYFVLQAILWRLFNQTL